MKNLIGFLFLWFLIALATFLMPVESNIDFVIYFPLASLLASGFLLCLFCLIWLFTSVPKQ